MTVAALLLEMCQISRACMFMELLLWRLTIHAPKTMVLTANDAFKNSLSSVAVDVCSPESYFSPIQLGFTVGNVNFKVRDTWRLVDKDDRPGGLNTMQLSCLGSGLAVGR